MHARFELLFVSRMLQTPGPLCLSLMNDHLQSPSHPWPLLSQVELQLIITQDILAAWLHWIMKTLYWFTLTGSLLAPKSYHGKGPMWQTFVTSPQLSTWQQTRSGQCWREIYCKLALMSEVQWQYRINMTEDVLLLVASNREIWFPRLQMCSKWDATHPFTSQHSPWVQPYEQDVSRHNFANRQLLLGRPPVRWVWLFSWDALKSNTVTS